MDSKNTRRVDSANEKKKKEDAVVALWTLTKLFYKRVRLPFRVLIVSFFDCFLFDYLPGCDRRLYRKFFEWENGAVQVFFVVGVSPSCSSRTNRS